VIDIRRTSVRALTFALLAAAVAALPGCRKTGEGQYEVEKPVVGTQTDTVNTPSVDVGTKKDTITTPDVDVKSKKTEVEVPTVKVKPPKDNP
jgi:hypothetical protein